MRSSTGRPEGRSTRRRFFHSIWLTLSLGGLLLALAILPLTRNVQKVAAQQEAPQKTADEIAQLFEAATLNVVPNGNPELLAELLKVNPHYAKKIEYG